MATSTAPESAAGKVNIFFWVVAQPVPGLHGRFFGDSSAAGVPVITPSRSDAAAPEEPGSSSSAAEGSNAAESSSQAAARAADAAAEEGEKVAGSGGLPRSFDGCLGDVVELDLDIVSALPQPLECSRVVLVVSIMQARRAHSQA